MSIRHNRKNKIMKFTFNSNTTKADKELVLEQCIELYNHKEFNFTVSKGNIIGIQANTKAVQLFCLCNELK